MPMNSTYDYAVIRVVPKVERAEFLNAGVIVFCSARNSLEAAVEVDERRLRALDPAIDVDAIRAHLSVIPAICAGGEESGPIGRFSQSERFDWLTAPRSTIIQTSPVHTGLCADPESVLEHLMNTLVRVPGTDGR
ncbi:MAG: DUF3037 domain-containing protein [Ignavibacteria bacterium]|nr:DUF3037 domain-containing protein [Ignavibacteria bacterium]